MSPLITTWLLLSLSPVVTVEGDAVCPTAADVATRLGALLPARATDEAPDVARLELRGGVLLVTLARPDGSPIGERAIDRSFACADLASAAAVVVATWESDVHPEFRLASPPPPPPSATPPPVAPPVVTAVPASRRTAASWDLGAALSGSLAPGSGGTAPALGALVVGSWTPGGGRLGARLALSGVSERELPLGAEHVRWQHLAAALGPQIRLPLASAPWVVDLHAEAVAGWLVASGQGFDKDLHDGSLDPGLGAGLRMLVKTTGRVVPWLEVSTTGWLRRQTAYSTPAVASVALPRFEALVALGLSYASRP
jgi:hypothetical protein